MIRCKACHKAVPDESIYCMYCGRKMTKTIKKRSNGEGTVYRLNGKWAAEISIIRSGIRLRKKKIFRTQQEAINALPKLKEQAMGRKAAYSPTLAKLYETYEATKKETLSRSKQKAYRIAFDKIPDNVKARRIDELNTKDLQGLVTGLTYYQARDIKTILSHLYKIAISEDLVHHNLADNIVLPKLIEKEQEAFTSDEILRFWADYKDGNTDTGYVLLMIYTGMMPGECQVLTKDMIDLDAQTISGAGLKTSARKKALIALPDIIVPVLQDLMAQSDQDLLWTHGKNSFYKMYKDVINRTGVRPLPAYSCRHTTATALAENNIELATIQKAMRHANIQTTTRYTHPNVEIVRESLNMITPNLPPNQ